jgi:lysozyme family protein
MSDKSKIARIQLALGIASDGIFGNQTLNAVRNKIAELIKLYGGSQLANSLYSLSLSEWQNSTNINTLYQIFTKVGLITA